MSGLRVCGRADKRSAQRLEAGEAERLAKQFIGPATVRRQSPGLVSFVCSQNVEILQRE